MFTKANLVKIAAACFLSLSSVQAMAETFNFKVTASGLKYVLDGDVQPVVNVAVGDTVVFDITAVSSHPLYITEKADSNRKLATGVTATAGQLVLKVDANTPKQLFYSCSRHARMGAAIQVVD